MNRGEAFIVRFWREKTCRDRGGWRGVVIHVPTGERVPVRSPSEAVQIMSAYLSAVPNQQETGSSVDTDS